MTRTRETGTTLPLRLGGSGQTASYPFATEAVRFFPAWIATPASSSRSILTRVQQGHSCGARPPQACACCRSLLMSTAHQLTTRLPQVPGTHGPVLTWSSYPVRRGSLLDPRGHPLCPVDERSFLLAGGTDHRNGVRYDQQDGSAASGCMMCDMIGACAPVARHVAKSAESNRARNLAWQS